MRAGRRWGCGEPVLSPNLIGDKATFLPPQTRLPLQVHFIARSGADDCGISGGLRWCIGLCVVFKVIPLLANDSEGTLLCNSLLPGPGAVIMTVKRCTISYLIAWFVVWAALHLSDVIVSLFWLEYDSGNLQE